jgi:uncharacterized protein YaeQ
MAAGATIRTLNINLSDVDRSVYETFELRVAQHPSESLGYLWSRITAYCLSYASGIRFSKGGLSASEEPPVAVWHDDGSMTTWIDVGAPSAERLHKACKAAEQVVLYSAVRMELLRKEASRRRIHRVESIDVWSLPVALLDELASRTRRAMTLEVVRTENVIYATINGATIEAEVVMNRLASP